MRNLSALALCLVASFQSIQLQALEDDSTATSSRVLVVNGKDAVRGRYPYFVTLQHYCAGALIAPDIVLSAGHCRPGRKEDVRPKVGTYSFQDDIKGVDYEQFNILQTYRHPEWVQKGDDEFIHDFVLIKLDGLVQDKRSIVKMNRHEMVPQDGQSVMVMGMGDTTQDPYLDIRPHNLQQASLQAISNQECVQAKSTHRHETYKHRIFPTHLCTTGGPKNKRDACSYDSGGPIIIPGETPEDDLLVALVSWGVLCGDPDFPGVNARVSKVSDWIDASVCAISADPPKEFCASVKHNRAHLLLKSISASRKVKLGYCLGIGFVLAAALFVTRTNGLGKRRRALDNEDSSPEQTRLFELDNPSHHHPNNSDHRGRGDSDSYESIQGTQVP